VGPGRRTMPSAQSRHMQCRDRPSSSPPPSPPPAAANQQLSCGSRLPATCTFGSEIIRE
jgi:hypothetical protein